jgi:methyl-accepting chemotaxis protein
MGSLRIAPKLGLVGLVFLFPMFFAVWLLVSGQNVQIDFASREVAGASYLLGLTDIQSAAATQALAGGQVDARWRDTLERLEIEHGGQLDTRVALDAVTTALSEPGGLVKGRLRLRELITRVGDRSNLILDNVLDSYYMTDIVLNRLPELVDRIVSVGTTRVRAGDPDSRATFLAG